MSDTFPLVTLPAASLRERSRELDIAEITTPEFQAFLDKLIRTMFVEDGVGIAAPQVGNNIRAIVVNVGNGAECYMNPEILKKSETLQDSEEGCLSVPGKFGLVKRHKKVTVRAINRHGRRVEFEAKQFPAIVFQHEVDHLDGVLFIDKADKVVEVKNAKHI
ncbi:peptide deformylase [Candidatus Uhrbacteria bacterium]|nr:peptide deformylase [Candidatus Uhrbacteria bacterium]